MFRKKKNGQMNKRMANKGFTMMEMIVTVALVSVFFGALALAIPQNMETYILEKRLLKGVEMSTIIENAIAHEFGVASNIVIVGGTLDAGFHESTDGSVYLSYVTNTLDKDGNRISEQRWFPANYDSSDVKIHYGPQPTNTNESASLVDAGGSPLKFTSDSICIEADGKPYIFNGVIDKTFYDEMSADVFIYYNPEEKTLSMKVRIYDEQGDVCTTEKAIVVYR